MPSNPLTGSDRQPMPGARAVGKANPNDRLEVTLVLRRRDPEGFAAAVAAAAAGDTSKRVACEDFAARFGADQADIAKVRAFAAKSKLTVAKRRSGASSSCRERSPTSTARSASNFKRSSTAEGNIVAGPDRSICPASSMVSSKRSLDSTIVRKQRRIFAFVGRAAGEFRMQPPATLRIRRPRSRLFISFRRGPERDRQSGSSSWAAVTRLPT